MVGQEWHRLGLLVFVEWKFDSSREWGCSYFSFSKYSLGNEFGESSLVVRRLVLELSGDVGIIIYIW